MQSANLQSLDDLIAHIGGDEIGTQSAGPCRLLMEHIQAARRNLLGSRRGEYRSSLRFAKESVACIPGKDSRAETTKVLQGLIDSEGQRP
jgi:hypothetical protein